MKKFYFLLLSLAFACSAFAATPADPTDVKWYDCGDESGYSCLSFTLPTVDVNGNPLDPEMMGYRIYTDDDQIFTFQSSVYTNDNLWGDATNIYQYQYNEGMDLTANKVYFYRTNADGFETFFNTRIGIQVFCLNESFGISADGLSNIVYDYLEQQPTVVPVPADPTLEDWYDYKPHVWPNGDVSVVDAWLLLSYGMDDSGNLVATDYDHSIDSCDVHELNYTILDKDKYSYSIYTDFDEIFVFNPEEYEEFSEPTTNVFIFNLLPESGTTMNFEFWGPHFPNRTTQVEDIEGMVPFPQWRIGIQAHYTVGDVTTSSNIVYLEVRPKPVTMLGDVNGDGAVTIADATALINYLLTRDGSNINKFNADVNDSNSLTIADVTKLINYLLSKQWN